MSNNTYNGWANRETWLVNLWLTNDGDRDAATDTLSQTLEQQHDDALTDIGGLGGVFADLLTGALARVEWREIAEHCINDAWPAVPQDNAA